MNILEHGRLFEGKERLRRLLIYLSRVGKINKKEHVIMSKLSVKTKNRLCLEKELE